jgi:hypothetical protein
VPDEPYDLWFHPGATVEWVGPQPLEESTGTVNPGDLGTVITDDRPASGIVVTFAGVGTFACERDEIRAHRPGGRASGPQGLGRT